MDRMLFYTASANGLFATVPELHHLPLGLSEGRIGVLFFVPRDTCLESWHVRVESDGVMRVESERAFLMARHATAGSDVVQSGRPIFDDFFQHLWPYIGNNTANVVFQIVKRLWLIRIDQ
ncbi:hypothetical protein TNCV_1432941 [Trichonephila clavipes]|nr:hypothetical protein TNCV_1432941 [Trichonephila clavipes]